MEVNELLDFEKKSQIQLQSLLSSIKAFRATLIQLGGFGKKIANDLRGFSVGKLGELEETEKTFKELADVQDEVNSGIATFQQAIWDELVEPLDPLINIRYAQWGKFFQLEGMNILVRKEYLGELIQKDENNEEIKPLQTSISYDLDSLNNQVTNIVVNKTNSLSYFLNAFFRGQSDFFEHASKQSPPLSKLAANIPTETAAPKVSEAQKRLLQTKEAFVLEDDSIFKSEDWSLTLGHVVAKKKRPKSLAIEKPAPPLPNTLFKPQLQPKPLAQSSSGTPIRDPSSSSYPSSLSSSSTSSEKGHSEKSLASSAPSLSASMDKKSRSLSLTHKVLSPFAASGKKKRNKELQDCPPPEPPKPMSPSWLEDLFMQDEYQPLKTMYVSKMISTNSKKESKSDWKKYWYVLTRHALIAFTGSETNAQNVVNASIGMPDILAVQHAQIKKEKSVFQITTAQEIHSFKCTNDQDRDQIVQIIQKILEINQIKSGAAQDPFSNDPSHHSTMTRRSRPVLARAASNPMPNTKNMAPPMGSDESLTEFSSQIQIPPSETNALRPRNNVYGESFLGALTPPITPRQTLDFSLEIDFAPNTPPLSTIVSSTENTRLSVPSTRSSILTQSYSPVNDLQSDSESQSESLSQSQNQSESLSHSQNQ